MLTATPVVTQAQSNEASKTQLVALYQQLLTLYTKLLSLQQVEAVTSVATEIDCGPINSIVNGRLIENSQAFECLHQAIADDCSSAKTSGDEGGITRIKKENGVCKLSLTGLAKELPLYNETGSCSLRLIMNNRSTGPIDSEADLVKLYANSKTDILDETFLAFGISFSDPEAEEKYQCVSTPYVR